MNGKTYVTQIGGTLSYRTAEEVDAIFNAARDDRRVHTVEELEEILRESETRALPFGMLYLAEGLEDDARRHAPG